MVRTFAQTFKNLSGGDNPFFMTRAEQSAYDTLYYHPGSKNIVDLLNAIQTLVTAIMTRGLGSQLNFDITSAPGDYADNSTELSPLIAYFQAIYGT